jgi:hypothetical protein
MDERRYARFQGYEGARWPKEVGVATAALSNPGHGYSDAPSVGAMSPRSTNPLLYWNTPSFQNLLIWQQPHPCAGHSLDVKVILTPPCTFY